MITKFYRNSKLNTNSVDPDQMPHSVVSDLGLHCLPLSFYRRQGINGYCFKNVTYVDKKKKYA